MRAKFTFSFHDEKKTTLFFEIIKNSHGILLLKPAIIKNQDQTFSLLNQVPEISSERSHISIINNDKWT
jgi:hypothetical protein